MATRTPRRKPEQKPDAPATTPTDGQTEKPETAAPETEKPDYGALDALAAEDAAKGEDWKPDSEGESRPAKPKGGVGAKELQTLYQMGFALCAVRLGAHWQLSEEEARELAGATDAVLEKYGAKMAMGPEFTLVVTAGVITVPRILVTASQQKPDQPGEETGQETERGGGADGGE